MKNWIIKTFLTGIAVFFLAWLLPGVSIEESYIVAILVAGLIGILNSFLRPILVILTLPVTILSLGLFMWVINAGMIMLADYILQDMFEVNSFWWALLFSALLSLISSFLHRTFLPKEEKNIRVDMNRHKRIQNESTHTTETGNKVNVEDGKKTIIIEKD